MQLKKKEKTWGSSLSQSHVIECVIQDGNHNLGPPQPLAFPATMVTKQSVRAMTEAQFFTAITAKGANYTYPLLTRPQVTAAAEIM